MYLQENAPIKQVKSLNDRQLNLIWWLSLDEFPV